MANGTNQDYTLVTSASNGIYNEEVIVAKLFPRIPQAPGSSATVPVRYKLKVIFWKWNLADMPKCATFNMELAITPVSMIGAGSATCPDGGTCSHLSPPCRCVCVCVCVLRVCEANRKCSLGARGTRFPRARFLIFPKQAFILADFASSQISRRGSLKGCHNHQLLLLLLLLLLC